MVSREPVRRAAYLLVCVAATLGLWARAANAGSAPDASSFALMPTHDVSFAWAEFGSGELSYTVTLASDAYIVYQGTQYPVTVLWGFYAVNKTGNSGNDFTATGADIGEWTWGQKPNKGALLSVGGWTDSPKKEALEPPASGSVSKQFAFSGFSFGGSAASPGLHISVSVPEGKPSPFGAPVGGIATGNIIPTEAPEPSSLAVLVFGLAGLGWRKRNGRVS
jgi:hypothetical protein